MVAKYAIEHWAPDPGRGRARARVPLPRPGRRRAHPGRLDQPVRRDHGHAHGGQARPRAGRPDASRSATPTARPSRASPTPCSTPTPAPRSPSRRPRRSWPRSPPATCSACTSPSCAAAPTPTRPQAVDAGPARDARQDADACWTTSTRSRELARWMADTRSVLFLGRHVGYPVAHRGRAQAQGARLHPRRGLRRRRAQARPDRADRARPAGLRDRAVAARSSTRCTPRSSPTSRRSAPAAPAPS